MTRRFELRRHVTVIGISAAMIITGSVWLVLRSGGRDVRLPRLSDLPPHVESRSFSATYNATMDRLRNDIVRRPVWTMAEAREIRDMTLTRYTYAGRDWGAPNIPIEDMEAFGLQCNAMASISERLQFGFKIDPPAREMLIATLVEHLESPMWQARLAAISNIVQSGLTDSDPEMKQRIEAMIRDPDPDVSANAVRQLRHRERVLAAWERTGKVPGKN